MVFEKFHGREGLKVLICILYAFMITFMSLRVIEKERKKAGAEQCQAQFKLGLYSIKLC
jgi:hypothetical protein